MQIRDFAHRVVASPELAVKLEPAPVGLADDDRCLESIPEAPGRPPELAMVSVRRAPVPSLEGWHDPRQRRRIVHALANHELQAAELFAWALLRFPDAPPALRRGLVEVLDDEQRHTRMYIARLEALGGRFGDYPVSGHFWNKAPCLTTPLRFLCAMSLTFENANLDHTLELAAAARAVDDPATLAVIERVHRDERDHVRLGWYWLERLKEPGQGMWEAYCANLAPPLHPGRASGRALDRPSRRAVGMDAEFIARLEEAAAVTDSGGHRLDPATGRRLP